MPKVELVDRRDLKHMSKPSGWFQVGWSHDYDPETVRPLRYFDKDYVAYRTAGGELIVADAFCPHFGAHLGHGGKVTDDCIVCPFHGWTWGPDGHNVSIPYSPRVNKSKAVHHHPVREAAGIIFMWHDVEAQSPWWEPPDIPELTASTEYYTPYPGGFKLWANAHLFPQFVVENNVDYAHVKYLHEWSAVPERELIEEGKEWFRSVFSGKYATKRSESDLKVDSIAYGVGLSVTRLTGLRPTVHVLGTTPVDEAHSDMYITVAVGRDDDDGDRIPDVVAGIRHAQLVLAYEQDIPVWANMKYNVTPPYPKEEAHDFLQLRKWSEQFYPVPPPYEYK